MADLNWNSRNLTHGWQKGVTAFYYGLGFDDADFNRAQIGIGTPLLDGNLCNVHAYELAKQIAQGCKDAGLIGLPFGTPAVSDNITQGQEGGNASLPSRNMIANGAEAVVSAHSYDGLIGLHNCDKNGPGFAMALARLNYPGLIVSGGSIMPGCHNDQDITILDVYDSQAALSVGATTQEDADHILRNACPGAGGCGIAASFNTWGICMEAIGLMLPFSSSIPAIVDEKRTECLQVGQALRHLLEHNIRPRDILTQQAFANAAVAMAAAGGSTNGILHLLALACEAQVDFGLKDIQPILRNTPVLCSFAPRGKRTMVDLHNLGGTPVLLKHLLAAGLIDGNALTVTGKTMAENLADVADVPADQDLIDPSTSPSKSTPICRSALAIWHPAAWYLRYRAWKTLSLRERPSALTKPKTSSTRSRRAKYSRDLLSYCATWVRSPPACRKSSWPPPRWPCPNSTARSLLSPIRAFPAYHTEPSACTVRPRRPWAGPLVWSKTATKSLLIYWRAT